jgi:hypothetical protein
VGEVLGGVITAQFTILENANHKLLHLRHAKQTFPTATADLLKQCGHVFLNANRSVSRFLRILFSISPFYIFNPK